VRFAGFEGVPPSEGSAARFIIDGSIISRRQDRLTSPTCLAILNLFLGELGFGTANTADDGSG
jgi:hypothetical protein